jgi:uncharacterized protein (UPF0332 family)
MTQEESLSASKYMEGAYEAIKAAEFNIESYPGISVEKAYYSLFYACHAALALKGLFPHSHEGVNNLIGKEYVNDGILPKEIAAALGNLATHSDKAKYNFKRYTTEDAAYHLNRAISAVRQIHECLREQYPDKYTYEPDEPRTKKQEVSRYGKPKY